MEKVICNVYYKLTHKIQYTHVGEVESVCGLFENKADAEVSNEIFKNAIKHIREEVDIKYIYSYNIEEILIPENRNINYFKSTNEFMIKNPHVVYYLEKYDPQLLERTKKLLQDLKPEESQDFPHPHDNITDEEDNFC